MSNPSNPSFSNWYLLGGRPGARFPAEQKPCEFYMAPISSTDVSGVVRSVAKAKIPMSVRG